MTKYYQILHNDQTYTYYQLITDYVSQRKPVNCEAIGNKIKINMKNQKIIEMMKIEMSRHSSGGSDEQMKSYRQVTSDARIALPLHSH